MKITQKLFQIFSNFHTHFCFEQFYVQIESVHYFYVQLGILFQSLYFQIAFFVYVLKDFEILISFWFKINRNLCCSKFKIKLETNEKISFCHKFSIQPFIFKHYYSRIELIFNFSRLHFLFM